MSNLIIERINSMSSPVQPRQIIPNVGEQKLKVENKNLLENLEPLNSSKPQGKKFGLATVLESLGLITSGGLLMYYGITRFSKVGIFEKIVKERLGNMEKVAYDFSNFVKGLVMKSFDEPLQYIHKAKKERQVDVRGYLESIKTSPSLSQVVEKQDNAFKYLSDKYLGFERLGLSEFDRFREVFFKSSQKLSNVLNGKKHDVMIYSENLTLLPKFGNDKHEKLVNQSERALSFMLSVVRNEIDRTHRIELRKIENTQSRKMANVIVDFRKDISKSKKMLIEEAYARVRKLENLPEDFKPTNPEFINTENFKKLDEKSLKRLNVWQYLDESLSSDYYMQILQSKDFSKFTTEDKIKYFYSMPQNTSVEDIVILIDRLRLKNKLDNLMGINSTKFYNSAISKLEFLYVTLKSFGKTELLKKCSKDFDNLTMTQRRMRALDVLHVSKKLGMQTYTQVKKDFLQNKKNYEDLEIAKYMEIFTDNPEYYFA